MAQLIYDSYDEVTRRSTWIEIEDGIPIINYSQDTRPILEANKAAANAFTGTNPEGFTRVASIPNVVVQRLMQTGIWYDQAAMKRWLNDPDNRFFRTDDGRSL